MSLTKRYNDIRNSVKKTGKISLKEIGELSKIFRLDNSFADLFNSFLKKNKIKISKSSQRVVKARVLRYKDDYYTKFMLETSVNMYLEKIVNSSFFGYNYEPAILVISKHKDNDDMRVVAKK